VARSLGRRVQSTKVRWSIRERVFEVIPIIKTVLDEDVSGARMGGSIAAGSRLDTSANRSASICRAR